MGGGGARKAIIHRQELITLNLPKEAFFSKSSLYLGGALKQERAFSTLFWLFHGETCNHLPTKVIESKFTYEIIKFWGCYTPFSLQAALMTT